MFRDLLIWINFWCYIVYAGIAIGAIAALYVDLDIDL